MMIFRLLTISLMIAFADSAVAQNPHHHNTQPWDRLESCVVFEEIAWDKPTGGWENTLHMLCRHTLQQEQHGMGGDRVAATTHWLLTLHNDVVRRTNQEGFAGGPPPTLGLLHTLSMPRHVYRNPWFNSRTDIGRWADDNAILETLEILSQH